MAPRVPAHRRKRDPLARAVRAPLILPAARTPTREAPLAERELLALVHAGRVERRLYPDGASTDWMVAPPHQSIDLAPGVMDALAARGLVERGQAMRHGPLQSGAYRWQLTDAGEAAAGDEQGSAATVSVGRPAPEPPMGRKPRTAPDGHSCPCGCGRTIARSRLACRDGWYRLPPELRAAVNDAYKATRTHPSDDRLRWEHRVAVGAALAWLRADREARGA